MCIMLLDMYSPGLKRCSRGSPVCRLLPSTVTTRLARHPRLQDFSQGQMLAGTCRVMPFSVGDWPVVMTRRKRSLTSMTRRHVMVSGSMSSRTNLQGSSVGA